MHSVKLFLKINKNSADINVVWWKKHSESSTKLDILSIFIWCGSDINMKLLKWI